jgi:hypothetical protein
VEIAHAGMPRTFISTYGKAEEHDGNLEVTVGAISKKLKKLISN